MAFAKKSEQVPKNLQEKYNEIIAITDDFAKKHLNEDYAQLIRYATAALARKRPSVLSKGLAKSWACGITHAIGFVNFLQDSSSEPYMAASDLYQSFGVSQSTGQGKSKQVRDLLDLVQMDIEWSTPEMLQNNPFATSVILNNQFIDARSLPKEAQEFFQQAGLFLTIPDTSDENVKIQLPSADFGFDLDDDDDDDDDQPRERRSPIEATENDIFHFEAFISSGPTTEAFDEKNPVICREIEILGKHTLADFHKILFKAFDREEEHMYQFEVGGDYPNDPKAECYVLPMAMNNGFGEKPAGCVKDTTIVSLNLSLDDVIGYWFDFGDDWWHQINLLGVKPKPSGRTKYPRITAREGASPPQYADFDDE